MPPKAVPQMQQPPLMMPQGGGGGNDASEMAQLKAQLAQMQRDQAEMKDKMGYQDFARKLNAVSGVYICQNIDAIEVATGVDMPNSYSIFALENGLKKGKNLFTFADETGCYARCCYTPDCRPMNMTLTNVQHGNVEDQKVIHVERPYKCTCYCINRQEMQVKFTEGGQDKYIGKITDPWDCCNHSVGAF